MTGPVIPGDHAPNLLRFHPPRPGLQSTRGPSPRRASAPRDDSNVTARQAAEWILANGGELTTEGENLFPATGSTGSRPQCVASDLATIDGVRLLPTSPEVFRHIPKLKALPGFKAPYECGRSDMGHAILNWPSSPCSGTSVSPARRSTTFMEHLAKAIFNS